MTVETFFANFGHLADAPNGVQKLRDLILQLAVQGKLVPQGDSKVWGLVQLGSVVEVLDRFRKPVTKHDRKPGPYPYYGASGIVDYVSKYIFDEPLVLVGEDGAKWACGENTAFRIEGKTWVNNHAHVLRPNREIIEDQYLVYVLVGLDLSPYITGMTVPKLNQARLVSIEFPLPPLEEQKRIVAKVDQLMALCDELEARQQKQQQGRVRLNSAALDALLTAREPDEFADHWQCLSTNFDLLYDHPETIAKLRAAILQLAVQGKLVPQDPNDEPASVLLERIKAEKERLVGGGRFRKTKPLTPVLGHEVPFQLPMGWEVNRFGDLTEIVGGVTKGRKLAGRKTAFFPYLRVANVQRWFVDLDVMKEIELPIEELEKYKLQTGDLLITEGGDWDKVGRTAVWGGQIENCLHQNHVFRARLFEGHLSRDWLVLAINSPVGREYFANSSKQTTNLASINMTQLKHFPMPVPPAAEQKRIVAKVDQLMTLCDELEAKLNQVQQHSEKLMEAAVRQLLGTSASQRSHTARPQPAPSPLPLSQRARGSKASPLHEGEGGAQRRVRGNLADLPLAAEAPAVYRSGGQAALPAANQPVPTRILAAMQPSQEYSRADILATTGIREADWMWAIKQLKEQGRVVQQGEKRGARYRKV